MKLLQFLKILAWKKIIHNSTTYQNDPHPMDLIPFLFVIDTWGKPGIEQRVMWWQLHLHPSYIAEHFIQYGWQVIDLWDRQKDDDDDNDDNNDDDDDGDDNDDDYDDDDDDVFLYIFWLLHK